MNWVQPLTFAKLFRIFPNDAEKLLGLDDVRRTDGFDRLAGLAGSLVDPAAEFRTEAQRQRRARCRKQVRDPRET
jgi:hypothetical protein